MKLKMVHNSIMNELNYISHAVSSFLFFLTAANILPIYAYNSTEIITNETISTTDYMNETSQNTTVQIQLTTTKTLTSVSSNYSETHGFNLSTTDVQYTLGELFNISTQLNSETTTNLIYSTTEINSYENSTSPIYSLKDYTFHIDIHFFTRYWKIFFVVFTIILFAVACIVFHFVHRKKSYESVVQEEDIPYNYIYKPAQIGYIDDEYENTFVGVSIPLLQDVTKV